MRTPRGARFGLTAMAQPQKPQNASAASSDDAKKSRTTDGGNEDDEARWQMGKKAALEVVGVAISGRSDCQQVSTFFFFLFL